MKKGYTAHTIVKNEDQWIWYAINSVLALVDKVLIFDTGSTDKTWEILKKIKSDKIILEQKGEVDRNGLVKLRQEQIDKTTTDWFLLVDGDEIWPENQLRTLLTKSQSAKENIVAYINRSRNCIGDVYHYLSDSSGRYFMAGRRGHLNIRLIRKTKDLKVVGKYPLESYSNNNGLLEKQGENLEFVDCWYLHTSFLKRSSIDRSKKSGSLGHKKIWERGQKMSDDEIPVILRYPQPIWGVNPLKKRGLAYEAASLITTPLLEIKRKFK